MDLQTSPVGTTDELVLKALDLTAPEQLTDACLESLTCVYADCNEGHSCNIFEGPVRHTGGSCLQPKLTGAWAYAVGGRTHSRPKL